MLVDMKIMEINLGSIKDQAFIATVNDKVKANCRTRPRLSGR